MGLALVASSETIYPCNRKDDHISTRAIRTSINPFRFFSFAVVSPSLSFTFYRGTPWTSASIRSGRPNSRLLVRPAIIHVSGHARLKRKGLADMMP